MLTIDFLLAFLETGKWDFWVFEFLEFNRKDNRRKVFLAKFKMLQRYREKKQWSCSCFDIFELSLKGECI